MSVTTTPGGSTAFDGAASTGLGADLDRRWQSVTVDPITLQVLGGALVIGGLVVMRRAR